MFNKWLNKKVKPGKDVLALTTDKNLDVIHLSTEIVKRKKKKKQFRKEKRLQEINERQQIKDINKSNKTPKGSSDLKNLNGNIIDIKDVEKIYTTKRLRFVALKKTSFSIAKGDFVVILGPSGSGKTTLLNIISGLDRATDGDVIVDDINISALTEKQMTFFRRKNIGFIFQSYNLLSSLNVVDNVEVGAILQKDKDKRQDTLQILKMLGIENISKKNIYELSGGQQQRVSIARALAKNPKILIGDEPTGALDEETTTKVLRIFQNINQQTGTTVIIVTHNSDIAKWANQVIYVKDGLVEKIKIVKR